MTPRHVLIAGAAGAIGAALVRALRAAWPETAFALLDREAAPMQALASEVGRTTTHVVDLRAVETLADVVSAIEREGGPLDGLINSAGAMRIGRVATSTWDDTRDLMMVDLLAPLRLQDLVVRGLVERGAPGVIVNITSMAGRVPLPGCAYYGAAKAGLAMASEVARAELAPRGIRVVTVYPGPIDAAAAPRTAPIIGNRLASVLVPTGDATVLARRIVHAIRHDEPRVIYPRTYALGWNVPSLASRFALSGPLPDC